LFLSAILLGNAKVSVALNLINDSSGLPDDNYNTPVPTSFEMFS